MLFSEVKVAMEVDDYCVVEYGSVDVGYVDESEAESKDADTDDGDGDGRCWNCSDRSRKIHWWSHSHPPKARTPRP